ncbi:hypothetical protein H0H93_005265, partial [Arthromyces matolae]
SLSKGFVPTADEPNGWKSSEVAKQLQDAPSLYNRYLERLNAKVLPLRSQVKALQSQRTKGHENASVNAVYLKQLEAELTREEGWLFLAHNEGKQLTSIEARLAPNSQESPDRKAEAVRHLERLTAHWNTRVNG